MKELAMYRAADSAMPLSLGFWECTMITRSCHAKTSANYQSAENSVIE